MPYINGLADEVVSISRWLGMESELEVIRRTFGVITPREQLQELLKRWLGDTERPTAPHTWEYFVTVVRGVRNGHVADRIVGDIFTGEYGVHILTYENHMHHYVHYTAKEGLTYYKSYMSVRNVTYMYSTVQKRSEFHLECFC